MMVAEYYFIAAIARLVISFPGLLACAYLWHCTLSDRRDLRRLNQNGINNTILDGQLRTVAVLTLTGIGFLALSILSLVVQLSTANRRLIYTTFITAMEVAWWFLAIWAWKDRRRLTQQVREYEQRHGERRANEERRKGDRRVSS